jgi:hypothetical protein
VGFPAAAVLVTQFLLHGEMRIDVAGLLCVAFSMIAYASPLSAMVRLIYIKTACVLVIYISMKRWHAAVLLLLLLTFFPVV